jgi:hypothetical protein
MWVKGNWRQQGSPGTTDEMRSVMARSDSVWA